MIDAKIVGEEDMDRLKAKAKINPPVRTREEAAKLWSLMARGWVDLVTSDHAPWPMTNKDKPNIFDNASGCPGVQTLGPLVFSEGVRRGRITLARFVQAIAENPARLYNLYPRKGTLLPGADADVAVVDPNGTWVISEGDMQSHATWSPFADMVLQGRAVASVVRGEVVYRDGEVVSAPGFGQELRPEG